MTRTLRLFLHFVAFIALIFTSRLPAQAEIGELKLSGAGLSSTWDRQTGRMTGLSYRNPAAPEQAGFDFFDKSLGTAGFEIFDELERVRYTDRNTPCRIANLKLTRIGSLQKVQFDKYFSGAPFVMHVTLTADAAGLHLEAETVFLQPEDGRWPGQRNIRISFVMPAREELFGWAPAYPDPALIREKPVRYCYGIQEPDLPRVGIPLYTVYAPGQAGLSMAMPLELKKVQLNLGPEPEDPGPLYLDYDHIDFEDVNYAGVTFKYVKPPAKLIPGKTEVLRLTEYLVGLTADRPLRFGVWLYGHEPHWRPALGHLVEAYPEYFRMHPRMMSIYGNRIGAAVNVTPQELAGFRQFGIPIVWLHTHFHRHGEFVPPQAVLDENFSFFCEPYAKVFPDNSVRKNRATVDALTDNGQGVFIYGFNMHCDTVTIVQRSLAGEVTRKRDGSVIQSYHDQPVMLFNPESPYGTHQLRQMDLLLQLYPRVTGVGLDNWAYGGIDYAHDDGITMFSHRPVANINFTQQSMLGVIEKKWHSAGRLVMINKARTVESTKGADAIESEAIGAEMFAMFAYMSLDRHLAPCEYRTAIDADYAEGVHKYCLEWGGQTGSGILGYRLEEGEPQATVIAGPEMSLRYFKLLEGVRNRTWVLDPDPLTLPPGTRGNIFRIHPQSPWNPGDVVVTVVRPDVKMADRNFKDGLRVAVRLPEAEKIIRASWLAVEKSDEPPVACRMNRNGGELLIDLPPVGSAGLLRLKTY